MFILIQDNGDLWWGVTVRPAVELISAILRKDLCNGLQKLPVITKALS
jgi:hypothetical protein